MTFPIHPALNSSAVNTFRNCAQRRAFTATSRPGHGCCPWSATTRTRSSGISFRTPPKDSTGVAHILEHSVLCGSRKYPVKEPFVELLKGSLQTFLNAFTFPDKTCYPVASANVQDFYNLIDVYFDAVFHPRINEHVLKQEGWHYETESEDGPLSYKGVVFNEMNGGVFLARLHPVRTFATGGFFPTSPMVWTRAGNPDNIPDLTFEQFKDFHTRYYHPSNSWILFLGGRRSGQAVGTGGCIFEGIQLPGSGFHRPPAAAPGPSANHPGNIRGGRQRQEHGHAQLAASRNRGRRRQPASERAGRNSSGHAVFAVAQGADRLRSGRGHHRRSGNRSAPTFLFRRPQGAGCRKRGQDRTAHPEGTGAYRRAGCGCRHGGGRSELHGVRPA